MRIGTAAISLAPLAFAILIGLFSPADAQTDMDNGTKTFIQKATIGNMFEIQSSQLALSRSDRDDVRDFAKSMIRDHMEAARNMQDAMTSAERSLMPTSLDDVHKDLMKNLRNANQADFDAQYISAQVTAHDEAVDLFKDYSQTGTHEGLKTVAIATLSTLREHQLRVHRLKNEIAATVGSLLGP